MKHEYDVILRRKKKGGWKARCACGALTIGKDLPGLEFQMSGHLASAFDNYDFTNRTSAAFSRDAVITVIATGLPGATPDRLTANGGSA